MSATLTTLAAVKRQLGLITNTNGTIADNTDDDTLIETYVIQASQMFETETRRTFSATSNATLTYDVLPPQTFGNKLFFTEDMLNVDRIVNAGTVIQPGSFTLLPYNGYPKYGLRLDTYSLAYWQQSSLTGWFAAIQIQGTMGYCETGQQPADVTLAVTKLAAYLYQTRDNNGDVVKFADGTMSIPGDAPQMVLRTINSYKRVAAFA